MDHSSLVYKVDNLVQSSLLSSLVFNLNTRVSSYCPILRTLSCNIIYIGKISRYLEGKYFEDRNFEIYNSRRVFGRF